MITQQRVNERQSQRVRETNAALILTRHVHGCVHMPFLHTARYA
jgi:hypothetical protein